MIIKDKDIYIYIYIYIYIGDVKICGTFKVDMASSHKASKKSNFLVLLVCLFR